MAEVCACSFVTFFVCVLSRCRCCCDCYYYCLSFGAIAAALEVIAGFQLLVAPHRRVWLVRVNGDACPWFQLMLGLQLSSSELPEAIAKRLSALEDIHVR
jgi:hypothetical protein